MGRKYKEELEREWEGKSLAEMKRRGLQLETDRNITGVLKGKYKRVRRRSK